MKTSLKLVVCYLCIMSSQGLHTHVPDLNRKIGKTGSMTSVLRSIEIQTTMPKKVKEMDLRFLDNTIISRIQTRKTKWGIENKCKKEYIENEYWFDSRIHTLGNRGFSGAFHAAIAVLSTKVIDVVAYDGINIREKLATKLSETIRKRNVRVVDLCCGVGISTRAISTAFPNAETIVGVDTSPEMVAMAEFLTDHTSHLFKVTSAIAQPASLFTLLTTLKEQQNFLNRGARRVIQFLRRNAEETSLPPSSFDLATVMYAFHEAPKQGRDKILSEARRLLQPGGTLAIIDISTDYTPPKSMLSGEPYVIEYQQNINRQLRKLQGFRFAGYENAVPGHVVMWTLKRV